MEIHKKKHLKMLFKYKYLANIHLLLNGKVQNLTFYLSTKTTLSIDHRSEYLNLFSNITLLVTGFTVSKTCMLPASTIRPEFVEPNSSKCLILFRMLSFCSLIDSNRSHMDWFTWFCIAFWLSISFFRSCEVTISPFVLRSEKKTPEINSLLKFLCS